MKILLCASLLILGASSFSGACFVKPEKIHREFSPFDDFVEYLETLDDDEALYVIAVCIVELRQDILSSGYDCLTVVELLNSARQSLADKGFPMTEEEFDRVWDLCEAMQVRAKVIKKLNFGRDLPSRH